MCAAILGFGFIVMLMDDNMNRFINILYLYLCVHVTANATTKLRLMGQLLECMERYNLDNLYDSSMLIGIINGYMRSFAPFYIVGEEQREHLKKIAVIFERMVEKCPKLKVDRNCLNIC